MMIKKNRWKHLAFSPYLWLFLVTSFLFGILFIRFILGEYAYVYLDVGSDTFDINYPLYCLFSDVLHGRSYEDYFLNVGLGMDMSSYMYQYLNPLSFLVLLLPQRLIPWGILLSTYLKLLLISIFGYKLFDKWIGHRWGSFVAALLWTFSSYVMLWGQHYGFCTAIVMFTIFLYLVHLFADDREKSRNWILIPWITLMLLTNYYFLYMSGILGAMYVLIYLLFRHASLGQIVRKLLGLFGMGILGICIGGVCLVSVVNVFFDSARAGSLAVGDAPGFWQMYGPNWLYTYVARLFSNNTVGIADNYTGAENYYEVAMLFTSSLFFLSLPYLVIRKKTRMKTLILTALSILFLLLPFSGKLFTMNIESQRWSFILCFLEALAVGMFVKFLLIERDRVCTLFSVAAGALLTAVGYGLLRLAEAKGYLEIDRNYLLMFVACLIIYIFLAVWKVFGNGFGRFFPGILVVVVCAELAVVNYPTINFRESPTRNQVAVHYYNDGTKEAYRELQAQDASLYRVAKTYESASENDSMVQDYPGLYTYMTVNPSELIELKELYGGAGISDNFVGFGNENQLRNALFGTKYLFANSGDGVSRKNYALVKTVGDKEIYENQNALPFGYLYDSLWEKERILELPEFERTLAILHGFYFTEGKDDTSYVLAEWEGADGGVSLIGLPVQEVDCVAEETEEGIRMHDMAEDPYMIWEDVEEYIGEDAMYILTLEMEASEEGDMALYYQTEDVENFSPSQVYFFHMTPGEFSWTCMIPGDATKLRLDAGVGVAEVTIRNILVNTISEEDDAAYERLKNSKVSDIRYDANTYRATVENTEATNQMLCVPLLYAKGWEAYLDGTAVSIYNINGGFCGVEIPAGTHQVTLQYEVPHKRAGIVLSMGGILAYLALSFIAARCRERSV